MDRAPQHEQHHCSQQQVERAARVLQAPEPAVPIDRKPQSWSRSGCVQRSGTRSFKLTACSRRRTGGSRSLFRGDQECTGTDTGTGRRPLALSFALSQRTELVLSGRALLVISGALAAHVGDSGEKSSNISSPFYPRPLLPWRGSRHPSRQRKGRGGADFCSARGKNPVRSAARISWRSRRNTGVAA